MLVRRSVAAAFTLTLLLAFTGCPDESPVDGGEPDAVEPEAADGGEPDAGPEGDDGGTPTPDVGPSDDGGTPPTDAGATDDGGTPPADAGATSDGGTPNVDAGPPDCRPEECGGNCTAIPAVDGARERCVGEGPAQVNDNCVDGGPPGELQFDNHCCSDADCTDSAGGVCASGHDFCGGAPPPQGLNTCRYPDCTVDGDCAAEEICAPAFFQNAIVRKCVAAPCTTDTDCTARAGGRCDFYGSSGPCSMPSILACSYADDACGAASGGQCTGGAFGQVCYPTAERDGVECVEVPPPPP